ncbi:2-hydroxyacid dehydrogenase [Methylobrevis albus]|uniref:Glyoxylate/hydroxypyruvate reductase A n=1 Tax=Methylobrevis albus TaxID=2793297 RepID=A0A931I0F7_9HYPH|nr:glyoxylate/hydroxypyruvate reductase A [Methylobrevis albus]MBH0237462.1 glyoxylate/hydroxypyruvate reductase A [Methylobrevis albus]
MTVLFAVAGWSPEHWVAAYREADPERAVVVAPELGDPAAIRYALAWKPPAGLLAGLPNLEVIFSLGAGVDHLLGDPTLPDLPLVRIVDPDLTRRMTDWVVLQALMHLRAQRTYDRQQRERRWAQHPYPTATDVRVGIMGFGVLGRAAARTLAAIGFDVAGWSRTPPADATGFPVFSGEAGLGDFLGRTDILVVLLPLTPETRGILGRPLFERLARDCALGGPVLINAGRGGLQVEADIVAAIGDGTLIGASLDVFATEPLPETSPLWADERVIITPHIAAESDPRALSRYVAGQIAAHERGEPLQNLVDRARGY